MSKALVAYFSASGVTAGLAQRLAAVTGADLFEIKAKVPYTAADLDWTNNKSRSSIEMKDKKFRPAVEQKLDSIAQYDTIYLGFPIWWYVAPTIINTFLEEYSFTGKTIIPFATSGTSKMGNTNAELAPSCMGAKLVEGKRFDADASENELRQWAEAVSK